MDDERSREEGFYVVADGVVRGHLETMNIASGFQCRLAWRVAADSSSIAAWFVSGPVWEAADSPPITARRWQAYEIKLAPPVAKRG